jgi:hypothetical protein
MQESSYLHASGKRHPQYTSIEVKVKWKCVESPVSASLWAQPFSVLPDTLLPDHRETRASLVLQGGEHRGDSQHPAAAVAEERHWTAPRAGAEGLPAQFEAATGEFTEKRLCRHGTSCAGKARAGRTPPSATGDLSRPVRRWLPFRASENSDDPEAPGRLRGTGD